MTESCLTYPPAQGPPSSSYTPTPRCGAFVSAICEGAGHARAARLQSRRVRRGPPWEPARPKLDDLLCKHVRGCQGRGPAIRPVSEAPNRPSRTSESRHGGPHRDGLGASAVGVVPRCGTACRRQRRRVGPDERLGRRQGIIDPDSARMRCPVAAAAPPGLSAAFARAGPARPDPTGVCGHLAGARQETAPPAMMTRQKLLTPVTFGGPK